MGSKIDKFIEKVAKDAEENDAAKILLDLLNTAMEELGDNPTEEEETAAILACLMKIKEFGNEEDTDSSEEVKLFMEENCRIVEEALDTNKLRYSSTRVNNETEVYELGMTCNNCRVNARVVICADPKTCRMEAILPITVDSIYQYIVCSKIVDYNQSFVLGGLFYDKNDGEIGFRYTFPIKDTINNLDVMGFLTMVIYSADKCYNDIKKCCVGKFNKKEKDEIVDNITKLMDDIIGGE